MTLKTIHAQKIKQTLPTAPATAIAVTIFMITLTFLLASCDFGNTTTGNNIAFHSSNDTNQINSTDQKDKIYHFSYDRFYIDPYHHQEPNPLEKMLLEDLNIELRMNVTVGSYSKWAHQFNSRITLGELPDLVFLSRTDLIKQAQDGVIIPLDEYLNKKPELKNLLTENQWQLSTVNQRVYSFPSMNPDGPYTAMYIRKDWLDHLGLSMPETTEELFEVLKAFTFEDPNQTGKNDTIGFTSDYLEFATLSTITNAFGLPQFGSTAYGIPEDWIDETDGELHFGPISNEYNNYLQYMNQLMDAGVIDQDIGAQTFMEYKQKMIQGQAGVVALFLPQYKMFEGNNWLRDIHQFNRDAEWVYLPPVEGPEGYRGNNAKSLNSTYSLAITKKVLEEPGKVEKAMELLEYMFRNGLEGGPGGQFIDFGIQDIHHQQSVQGDIIEFLPQYYEDQDKYMIASTMWGLPNNKDVLKISASEQDYETFLQMEKDRRTDVTITNYYYSALPFAYKGNEYIRQMSLKFVFGEESFDNWDVYVETLNNEYRYELVQQIRRNELKDLGLLSEE
ncbi:extracellular solute-binding protein [Evansella tamaricis]|uniref:Extracellular solute-binding protein n=1 Tax=Evansella tamaricis TaxID=2069301 RepID=A0ABS6JI43_9BACI|nr:extracellular solute-binding protein [Evansella tamaricis]MBU9713341.1 extracellular solute-binding protein [Evansella tamaricis]